MHSAAVRGLEGSVDTRACLLQLEPDCLHQSRYLPKLQSVLDRLGGSLLTLPRPQVVSLLWCLGVLEFWVPLFVWLEECRLQSMCVGGISQLIISNKSSFQIIFSLQPHHTSWGILIPQPRIEPMPPAVEGQSPNHWATREFPHIVYL